MITELGGVRWQQVAIAQAPPRQPKTTLDKFKRLRHDGYKAVLIIGVRLVWVVDPKRQTVTVYRSWTDAHTLRADETLDGGDVLPGFACRVSELSD